MVSSRGRLTLVVGGFLVFFSRPGPGQEGYKPKPMMGGMSMNPAIAAAKAVKAAEATAAAAKGEGPPDAEAEAAAKAEAETSSSSRLAGGDKHLV